jgi:hypothetical protein
VHKATHDVEWFVWILLIPTLPSVQFNHYQVHGVEFAYFYYSLGSLVNPAVNSVGTQSYDAIIGTSNTLLNLPTTVSHDGPTPTPIASHSFQL